jgi:DNA repair exonuclease SbcCD ATPase subunit
VFTWRSAVRETKTYTIRNVDSKPKTLVVEHAVRQGYRLIDAKPSETTASAYRFEVKLAPQGTQKLAVTEENLISQTVVLTNASTDFLMLYVENKELDAAGRKQLERIVEQKRAIAENNGEIQRTESQINDLVRDQERIRQNIESLNRVSGQQEAVQNYARQLVAQDGQLTSLRERQAGLKDKKTALAAELNRLIEGMEF